ncbi:MAG: permease prefix domain 1-containing protein [Firmicutes bacterium]|nr:permease prefix domain 1-containing protein [Bacillota bacterium]
MDSARGALETYLRTAVAAVSNRYRARRLAARLRQSVLEQAEKRRRAGLSPEQAIHAALAELGSPEKAVAALIALESHDRSGARIAGLLQFLGGLIVALLSSRAQYLPGVSLGRLLALGGVLVTGWQVRTAGGLRTAFAGLRWTGLGPEPRPGWMALVILGALSGVAAGLSAGLPWLLGALSPWTPWRLEWGLTLVAAAAGAILPWRVWPHPAHRLWGRPGRQAMVSLTATAAAVLLWRAQPSTMPPPCFDWTPWLSATVGLGFFFWLQRLYGWWLAVHSPWDPWSEVEGAS